MQDYLPKLYQLGALPVIRPGVTSKVVVGATSASSGQIGSGVVRLLATSDCHIAIGSTPVADTNSMFLPANMPEYFACLANDSVAAIQESTGGTLYVTPAL